MCSQTPTDSRLPKSLLLHHVYKERFGRIEGFGRVRMGVARALLLEPCYLDSSIGLVAAMADVIACDVSCETLGYPPDDFLTYPVQLVPVLAMCSICSGPADGSHGKESG